MKRLYYYDGVALINILHISAEVNMNEKWGIM